MKNLVTFILILLFTSGLVAVKAQSDCLVLKPQIANKYEGKCKNGLAHGKGKASGLDSYEGQFKKGLPSGTGIYKWSNGDSYTGEWAEGFREGEGSFTYTSGDKDTTISGIWERDEYIGPVPEEPKVLTSRGVDRYNIDRVSDIKHRVLINFYQNGARNRSIEDLIMASSSGYDTRLGESVGFDEVTFPVVIKVNYTTLSKLRGAKVYVIFEFKIFEPGDWKVDLHN